MKKYDILGVKMSIYPYHDLVKKIIDSSLKNIGLQVAPIASHSIVESQFDNNLKATLNKFDLVLPDGQSLIWATRFIYNISVHERIYGPDLFLKLCLLCEKEKIRVILFGNDINLVSQKLKEIYPKLTVTALPDLNYKKITDLDVSLLLKTLGRYKKSITFIGIGSPAQHLLLAKLKKVEMPIVAVGAAFNFITGAQRQAPQWIGKSGFEWLFRLLNEPQRLWKRYLIYAPLFICLVFLQKLSLLTKKYAQNN